MRKSWKDKKYKWMKLSICGMIPPLQMKTSTNHFSVKLNPHLFTIYIWLYDFDQSFNISCF